VEHLHAGEARGVDPPVAVHLDAVGEARRRDREQPGVGEVASVGDVVRNDVVGQRRVIAAGFLVGSTVGDVERVRSSGENARPFGLTKESATTESRSVHGS
jgi:hypothetical protein